MTTRRDVVFGAIAASTLSRAGSTFAEPSQTRPSKRVSWSTIPRGSTS